MKIIDYFQKRENKKKFLPLILIAVIFYNLFSVVYPVRDKYFANDYWKRFPEFKKTYYNSQYATKYNAKWVRDETAYSYAGGALIRGENPVYVIPDAPPLGKYLIGVSAVIFNNENIVSLFFGTLSLYMLFVLGKQVLKSNTLALLPPFFLSFEPLFKNQFVFTPLFDTMQLVFLLLVFYFFNKGLVGKYIKNFILVAIFIGLFISTKFFVSGITIFMACYIVLFLRKDKKRIIAFTLIAPLSVVILLLSYVWVFAYGYQFNRFLGIQKWIFLYHKGQLGHAFSIWPLIMINKWYVWFGNKPVISDSQWLPTWPVTTIISIVTIGLSVLRRIKPSPEAGTLMAWVSSYFLFFSIGQISTRYFVILLPVLYLLTIYGLKEALFLIKKN